MRLRGVGALCVLLVLGCLESQPHAPFDVRFATPLATVHTLLDAYGVDALSQEEIDRRVAIGRTFHLHDPQGFEACFADWSGPEDKVLGDYVFGSLFVAKDDLVATVRDDEAEVMAMNAESRTRPVFLERQGSAWRIVLERSVPRSAQRELRQKQEELLQARDEASP